MNRRKQIRENDKKAQWLKEQIRYAEPQKTLSSEDFKEYPDDYRDPTCAYRSGCHMQNCLACKRLK